MSLDQHDKQWIVDQLKVIQSNQEQQGKSLVKLITEVKESLEREMRQSATRIERAIKRHSSMIVSGTEAIGGLEKAVQGHDERFAEVEKRLADLEKRNGR